LASSWHGWYHDGQSQLPIQEDETALVLWSLWHHFDKFRDIEFIKKHYRGLVIRAANWLCEYWDTKSKLPLPSWDLWEERYGIHAWTVGAVWAGLMSASRFAKAFGQTSLAQKYADTATILKKSIQKKLWSPSKNRFLRMIKQDKQNKWIEDEVLDASLVGLWYFGMFEADAPEIEATMLAIKDTLWVKTPVGGIARYENDYYHQVSQDLNNVPGNPWFISTLWVAQWFIAKSKNIRELEKAMPYIQWATDNAQASGVLAEQVDPYTGAPLSVSPLTWSHATMVMTVRQYMTKQASFSIPMTG